ncbi:hypothetical protein H6P81_004555 [Aristolochia fimbriata]|uniref:RNase H type-1 domain-containing protein n=1 Tax=Aristolochia fimbriata TaxID=158543 RepID=A0AAV7FHU3_ARIFI|nr:hypothetical protein H6P81_004555 [Aristolochia fimbriata]
MCMPNTFGQLVQQWYSCPLPKCGQVLWRIAIAAIIWQLWLERNSRVFNNQCSSLGGVIEKVIHNTLLWAGASQKLPPLPSSVIRKHWKKIIYFSTHKKPQLEEWKPPPAGHVKLNFDGSSFGNPGQAGIGGVVRDSGGHCIFVYSGPAGCCSSNEAEAQAMLTGEKLLREHVTEPVYVEGDSKLVIRWAKAGKPPWKLKPIFDELKLVTQNGILFGTISLDQETLWLIPLQKKVSIGICSKQGPQWPL